MTSPLERKLAAERVGRDSRRARDGAFYTDGALARFVVERVGEAWRAAGGRAGEARIWDPACGDGAFLRAAAAWRAREQAGERDGEPAGATGRDHAPGNLVGTELNAEAAALAARTCPEATVVVGDALRALDPHAADAGPFDLVVGNPPFVRHERIADRKPALRGFACFHGGADLYVYFVERALERLAPGGHVGLVLPNKWLRAGYAAPLRAALAAAAVEVVDFGHVPLFPGADAFPSVLVARARARGPVRVVRPRRPADVLPGRDGSAAPEPGWDVARETLGAGPWTLEPTEVEDALRALEARGEPLGERSPPRYGLKSGLNAAFVVDRAGRDALLAAHPSSAAVLRPYLRGRDLGPWRAAAPTRWLLALHSSADHPWPWADAADPEAAFTRALPAVAAWMKRHEAALRARADQGRHWWELRPCRYLLALDAPKLAWPDLCWAPAFVRTDALVDNTAYFVEDVDPWRIAALHHPYTWAWAWRRAVRGKDDVVRLKAATVAALPLPREPAGVRADVAERVGRLVAGEGHPDDAAALREHVTRAWDLPAALARTLRDTAPPRTPSLA